MCNWLPLILNNMITIQGVITQLHYYIWLWCWCQFIFSILWSC